MIQPPVHPYFGRPDGWNGPRRGQFRPTVPLLWKYLCCVAARTGDWNDPRHDWFRPTVLWHCRHRRRQPQRLAFSPRLHPSCLTLLNARSVDSQPCEYRACHHSWSVLKVHLVRFSNPESKAAERTSSWQTCCVGPFGPFFVDSRHGIQMA